MPKKKSLNSESNTEIYKFLSDSPFCEIWEDPAGNILLISPECKSIFGYDVEELTSNSSLFDEMVIPSDKKLWRDFKKKSSAIKNEVTISMNSKSGKLIKLLFISFPIKNKFFTGLRVVAVDLTAWDEKVNKLYSEKVGYKQDLEKSHKVITKTLAKLERANQRLEKENIINYRTSKIAEANAKKYETFFNSAKFGVVVFTLSSDQKFEILEINENLKKLLGYSGNNLLGKNFSQFVVSKSGKDEFGKNIQKLKNTDAQQSLSQTISLIRKDGSELYASITATRFKYFRGYAVSAIINDLTKEKILTEKIIKSEERYKNFIENSKDAIYRIEYKPSVPINLPVEEQAKLIIKRGYIAECNNAFAAQYGFKHHTDLEGRRLLELYGSTENKKNLQSTIKFIKDGYRTDGIITHELDSKKKDLFLLKNVSGFIKDNHLLRTWGIQYDITEQIKIQSELEEINSEFRELFMKGPVPKILANSKFEKEMVNEAFTKAFGYTSDDISNIEDWWKLAFRHKNIDDNIKKYWFTLAREAKSKGKIPPPFETSIIDKYGSKRRINISFGLIGAKFLISFFDLTELHKAKEDAERARNIIENSPHVIWHLTIVNNREKLVFITKNVSQFGYNAEELLKNEKSILKTIVYPEDLKEVISAPFDKLKKEKKSFHGEFRVLTKSGEVRWIEAYSTIHKNTKNNRIDLLGIVSDITERKLSELELERNRNTYSAIFQNTPFGILYFNSKGEIIDFNDRFVIILGSTKSKLKGINFLKYLRNKGVHNAVVDTLKGKKGEYRGKYTIITSGKTVDIRFISTPIIDEKSGEINGLALLEDITEQQRVREQLIASHDEFKRLAEEQNFLLKNINDLVYRQDVNGNYEYISPSVKKILGYSPKEYLRLTRDHSLLSDNPKNNVAIENTKRILEKGEKIKPYVVELLHKSGRKVQLEINENPILINGDVVGLIGVARDITEKYEREKIQEALFQISNARDNSENLYNLYDNIYSIIRDLMPAENVAFSVYSEVTKLLSFEFFTDQHDSKPEPHPLKHGFTEYILKRKKGGIFKKERIKKLIDSGKIDLIGTLPESVLAVYFVFSDTMKGVALLQDYNNPNAYGKREYQIINFVYSEIILVINKKQAEEDLIRSNKELTEAEAKLRQQTIELRKVNDNKDKFFSIVAHDLRSPFTALLGLSKMLADSVDEFEKEEIEEIARALNNSSNNIFKLIENLLNWARIQLGSFDISLHNFTLFDPVINTLLVLNEAAKQKNITLINRIKKSIYVYADENSVEMIVRNLINNAIKFTNEGGKITISASQKKGFATVTVADTGIGMPKEILGKLFDISQKVSRSGTNNEPGTGLGLILVKELVEKNGGTISVKSSEGKGSKFIFTLPLAKEE